MMMNFGNTEEAFVLSTLKEFVKIWGSGSHANLNLECLNGNAWVKLAFQLGSPASQHYLPHHAPQTIPLPHQPRRRKPKGPARREKDRVRAAAHRARLVQLAPHENTTHRRPPPSAPAAPTGPLSPAASAGTLPSRAPQAAPPSSPPGPPSAKPPPEPADPLDLPSLHPVAVTAIVQAGCPPAAQALQPEDPPHHLHLAAAAVASVPRVQVIDELKTQDFFYYLEEQKRLREAQIEELSRKVNFGFNPRNGKPPF